MKSLSQSRREDTTPKITHFNKKDCVSTYQLVNHTSTLVKHTSTLVLSRGNENPFMICLGFFVWMKEAADAGRDSEKLWVAYKLVNEVHTRNAHFVYTCLHNFLHEDILRC